GWKTARLSIGVNTFFHCLTLAFRRFSGPALISEGGKRAAAEGRRIGRFSALHGFDLPPIGGASSWPRSMKPGASGSARRSSFGRGKPDLPAGAARTRAPQEAEGGAKPKARTERVRMAAKRTLARTSRAVGQLEGRERPKGG